MKIYNYILCVLFLILTSQAIIAQEQSKIQHVEMGGFIDKEAIPLIGTTLNHTFIGLNHDLEDLNTLEAHNQVFVRQIGAYNTISSNVSSQHLFIKLMQEGNSNEINMDLASNYINFDFSQTGTNNSFYHSVYSPSGEVKVNMSQNGNGNHIEKYGSNSISNKVKLDIKGDYKTLIIRNFQ